MIFKVTFCSNCDATKYPKEPIVWEGVCHSCKKDTAKIVVFDIPDEGEKLIPA